MSILTTHAGMTDEQLTEGFETLWMAGYSKRAIEDALYMTWEELAQIPEIFELMNK